MDLKHNYETKLVYLELARAAHCSYGSLGPLTASVYMVQNGKISIMRTLSLNSDFEQWTDRFQLTGSTGVSTADVYAMSTSAAFPEVYIEIQGMRTIQKNVKVIEHSGALVNSLN